MSLTKVSYSMINSAPLSVDDYRQSGDTDDTASFNRAILAAALAGGGIVVAGAGKNYTIGGTVLLAQYVDVDLQNATLTGTLSTTMFETGYLSGGAIVTNIGTANESHTLYRCRVYNGIINSSKLAFNLFNFINQCELFQIRFNFCERCVFADRCFYASFINLTANNESGPAYNGIAAFNFQDNVNAMVFDGLSIGHRHTGIYINGAVFQSSLLNCEVERGVNGIIVEGVTDAFEMKGCYFEQLSGTAINMNFASQKRGTVIDNNLFFLNSGATAIKGQLLFGGAIGPGNRFSDSITKVEITDNQFSDIIVYVNGTGGADNASGEIPADFILGTKVQVVGYSNIFSNATGNPLISSLAPSKLLNFNYVGDAGTIGVNNVAFSTHYGTGSGTFNIGVDTNITAQSLTNLLAFYFEITDNVGTYEIFGNVYGDNVVQHDTSGKTVTLTGPGGKVTLTLSSFSHPSGSYTIKGVVRHI